MEALKDRLERDHENIIAHGLQKVEGFCTEFQNDISMICFYFSSSYVMFMANEDAEIESFVFEQTEELESFAKHYNFSKILSLFDAYRDYTMGWIWFLQGCTGYNDGIQFNLLPVGKPSQKVTIQLIAMVNTLKLFKVDALELY